ncbi:butyrophilin-like protein 2 [Sinocyclocheilus anshuiensis]|uniref:butyrophilin-like protein 2 n=1 Tax=Sinocyclocheilus anshuiensis TaxID=1608454 RepID=UPI0007B9023C|nr:PREDICTED: butyrophilin-like protein 2 [Sinocyclocheilus anshuiensis]
MRQHLNVHRHKVSSNAASASSFDFEQDMTSEGNAIPETYEGLQGLPVVPQLTVQELKDKQRADKAIQEVILQQESGKPSLPVLRKELAELPFLLREWKKLELKDEFCPCVFSLTDDFQLVIPGRGERVKINSGSTLTVSCHLSPAISAVDMEITWFGVMSCVCAYKNREMTQGVGYEGRARLFIHDLKRGNVSLRVADYKESDLGVYTCQVTSRNKTQQITVNVAEEVSAIFKDQHFFTVNYKMGETNNKLSIHSAYHSASGKDQRKDYKEETDNKLSLQYIKSHLSRPDNKQSGDNKMGTKGKENFQLVVPSTSQEPEASLGSDLIITCYLSTEISAVDMEISWSNDTACVCLYKDRQVTEGVLFKDRASLFTHKLKEGNVSLRLKNFRLPDIGNYHCQVISKDRREKITVRVRIHSGVQSMSQSPIFPEGNQEKRTREPTNKLSRHTSHHSKSDEKQHGNYSKSVSDNFQLVIPQTAQEAQIYMGSKIIVPCHLSPEICAIAMQIKWFKETDCVCIYKNGHVIEGSSYKDRASLATHILERGNVSLHLNNFSVSDVGDYYCQVISGDRTQQITVGVRIKSEVQHVSQSPTFQGRSIQLKLFETDKIWTKQETDKMNKSALMAEELQKMLIKACKEKDRQLERAEQELRETRKMLDRLLRLNPHAQFLDRDKSNPSEDSTSSARSWEALVLALRRFSGGGSSRVE